MAQVDVGVSSAPKAKNSTWDTHNDRLADSFAKLPFAFEANTGQTDAAVKFLARGSGYTMFLTPTAAVLSLRASGSSRPEHEPTALDTHPDPRMTALRMKFVGANPAARLSGLDERPGKVHYLRGNDSGKWRANVPTFAKVHYRDVYPGTDLVFYGNRDSWSSTSSSHPAPTQSRSRFSSRVPIEST